MLIGRAVLCVLLTGALGQMAPPPVQMAPPSLPVATVVVRLPAGKSTYHVGEEIPIELEFRGKAGRDYYFSTKMGDRSGRMEVEQYNVTPTDGTDDPLADLLSDGYIGGGGDGAHPLDDTPFIVHVSLNDWVRFNRPGTFQLVVTSARLKRAEYQAGPVLISAPLELTITPADEAWAAGELQRAMELIGRGDQANVRRGTTLLRYLGTEAAAKMQVERYDAIHAIDGWSAVAGVMSSPRRASVVHDMETHVDAGDLVDPSYIPTLVRAKVLLEMPRGTGDPKVRADRRAALEADYDRRWRAAITRTPMTAAKLGAELDRVRFGQNAEWVRQVSVDLDRHPVEARTAFLALPDAQYPLLEHFWPLLNRPWIVPALREVYNASRAPEGSPAADAALTRLTELNPDEGRALILEEIRTGSHSIGYSALAALPEATLPQLDDALLARPMAQIQSTLWLIARYGSPKLLPFMVSIFGGNSCQQAAPQLVYLSKTDPAAAVTQLRACDTVPFLDLTRHWDERFEAEAILRLNHANAQQVGAAAQALGDRGSAAVKAPLLDRLTRWSAEWRGRPELAIASPTPGSHAPAFIEGALIYGLFQNKQFTLTLDDAAKIRALCVTDSCRQRVDAVSKSIH